MDFIDWKSIFSGVAMIIAPISAWYLGYKQQQQNVEAYYMNKIIEENAKLHQENDRLAIQVQGLNNELIKMKKALSVNGIDIEVERCVGKNEGASWYHE